jgi:hypothetical protein
MDGMIYGLKPSLIAQHINNQTIYSCLEDSPGESVDCKNKLSSDIEVDISTGLSPDVINEARQSSS